jgi:eukaryotic-like serine/threonine-protein kinase
MRVCKAQDKIKDYQIVEHLNTGAMANAYAAISPDGLKVFFKQYKSPAVSVNWFKPYVQYQKELNHRVREPSLKRFCVNQIEAFVADFGPSTFFQVYEFVEGGHDLGTILEKLRKNPGSLNWNQRVILAKVMMAGVHQLHAHKIVHCDLKPPNLQMFADPTIEAGYQLKLIDMDFSVLADRRAPWDGLAPYVGSPRYFSPEHLRGEVPQPASDVFTCGLILYELLAEGHPYPAEDEIGYFEKVKAHSAGAPHLAGSLAEKDATDYLASIIHRCLSPDASERPSAMELNLALNGRTKPQDPSLTKPSSSAALRLTGVDRNTLSFNIKTLIGKSLLRQFGEEARFASDHQFTLERRGTEWWLLPQSEAVNFTLINGKRALGEVRLKRGDKIELGSRKSERTVLPLTVDIE